MEGNLQKKSKSHRKGKSKISFDEEVVTKEYAKKLVYERKEIPLETRQSEGVETNGKQKNKRKRNKSFNKESESENKKTKETNTTKGRKRKIGNDLAKNSNSKNILQTEGSDKSEVSPETANGEKKESIRGLKRKKHAKLLEDKKVKLEIELQQKALNYLSKWKHSKSEWKFEKLRQVWLQQNLFDTSKVPNEFWDTAVQYFTGAQGHSRKTVLEYAIKCIENEGKSLEENTDESCQMKLTRARDIVQNLG